MIHELKSWPQFMDALITSTKTFEVRKNDRDFKVGDYLMLREFDPATGKYGRRVVGARVIYAMYGPCLGIADGWVCMSIDNDGCGDVKE